VSPSDRAVVDAYFAAMQAGPAAEADLLALFTDDAVYVEPFSGEARTHRGTTAIRAMLKASWTTGPPDLVITVHRVDLDGDEVVASWSCKGPSMPTPVRGTDRYVLRGDRIARLETTLEDPAPG
jgi:uncharacterized protein (TIGR02246 family)